MGDVQAEVESPLRFVLDHARDAYFELDHEFVLTEWNRRAEEVLGWRRHQVLGRPVFDVVPPQLNEVIEHGVTVLRAGAADGAGGERGRRRQPSMAVEMALLRSDGTTVVANGTVFARGQGDDFRVGAFVHHTGTDLGSLEAPQERLHDLLTGLPSRGLFANRLHVALGRAERPATVAVAAVGLDRFKAINEAMGHDVGDELLVAVVGRLRRAGGAARPMLARLAGDEFLAMFEDAGDGAGASAERFVTQALAAVAEPFQIAGHEIFLTASAGIATADGRERASTLVSNAEAAMHESKAAGGDRYQVFSHAMRRQIVDRMTTESSLHRALDRRELALFYQPVVAVDGGPEVVAVEALLRWWHPERGLVGPDQFIPVAEDSGLIIPIGAWVLEEAGRQLREWWEDGEGRPGSVEVNLSARQVDHPSLLPTVERVLEETGLPPGAFTLEITESALMKDAVGAHQVLQALKSLGVALAIDDFGTGYSSLGYLQRFPLDILKVDKSFVDGLGRDQGTEIVAAVVNLAHALGLEVVAEGVETPRQLEALRELGCDFAQGYLFSRPVPPVELRWELAVA